MCVDDSSSITHQRSLRNNYCDTVLPWLIVRDALTAAFSARFVDRASGQWPCDYAGAGMVRVRQRTEEVEKKVGADGKVEVHDPDAVYKPGFWRRRRF